jgi:hypothetical protein
VAEAGLDAQASRVALVAALARAEAFVVVVPLAALVLGQVALQCLRAYLVLSTGAAGK